jgi:hypothetical protein
MFRQAYAREASDDEVKQSLAYLAILQQGKRPKQARELAEQENSSPLESSNHRHPRSRYAKNCKAEQQTFPIRSGQSAPDPRSPNGPSTKILSDTKGKLERSRSYRLCPHRKRRAWFVDGKSMAESGSPAENRSPGQDSRSLGHARQPHAARRWRHHRAGARTVAFSTPSSSPRKHPRTGSPAATTSIAANCFEGSPPKPKPPRAPCMSPSCIRPMAPSPAIAMASPTAAPTARLPAASFEPDKSQILLGCRHGSAQQATKASAAASDRARLYDRALTRPKKSPKPPASKPTRSPRPTSSPPSSGDQRTQP